MSNAHIVINEVKKYNKLLNAPFGIKVLPIHEVNLYCDKGSNNIWVSPIVVKILSDAELRAVIGHEYGHLLHTLVPQQYQANSFYYELLADTYAIRTGHNPIDLITGIFKLYVYNEPTDKWGELLNTHNTHPSPIYRAINLHVNYQDIILKLLNNNK